MINKVDIESLGDSLVEFVLREQFAIFSFKCILDTQ